MKITNLKTNKNLFFKNIKVIEPKIYHDDRGFFYESWNKKNFNENVSEIEFLQENHSFSLKNVLRGLHFQNNPYSQGKLVECITGEIYDVVVDIRKESETFLQWGFVNLSERNKKQIWINSGFAHGFYTLSKTAHVIYKVDNSYNKDSEKTIIWDDPQLSIKWPKMLHKPIISQKDLKGYSIKELTQMGCL